LKGVSEKLQLHFCHFSQIFAFSFFLHTILHKHHNINKNNTLRSHEYVGMRYAITIGRCAHTITPTLKNLQEENVMRNMFVIMVLAVGALLVFTTYGHCRSVVSVISADPHDEGFGIAVSAQQNTVENLYIIGDPHEKDDVALTRTSTIVWTTYISGDPHSDGVPPVVRRPVVPDYISGDPHE
jgi:hypothetical protein